MRVKSIKKIGKARVINLTVHKNHTFITRNGIVTHNCDYYTESAQSALRGSIEEFAINCRFILTCNYITKLIPAIVNRFEVYNFDDIITENVKEITPLVYQRLKEILENEKVEYQDNDLINVIKNYHPSIRGMISCLQKSTFDNKLNLNIQKESDFSDIIELIRKRDFDGLLKIVYRLSNADKFYEYAFKKLDIPNQNKPNAIVILAKYQYQNAFCRDKNLNLAACLMELAPLI